jgi:hypothetical protein
MPYQKKCVVELVIVNSVNVCKNNIICTQDVEGLRKNKQVVESCFSDECQGYT